ncbi:aspartate kinase [Amedibacillus dolichus]|uniref:Aspartokinase n=1 Tax=Amedibacillus dolichus TaxID=31971 RepID=A0A415PAN4_9FIRM|nr:aspartate kinase [Amedibacillus dolichus]RHM09801.1 aspartate kinase [Amedibacillus dolichus]
MIKITKFGGSSVANATQFAKVKQIIESDSARRFVVVSASGREHKNDNKVTDLLYLIEAHIKYSVDYHPLFQLIENRFLTMKRELNLTYPIENDLEELKQRLNKTISTDYLVSRGEYLTAKLMAEYLGFPFLDAKDIIIFRYNGKIDFDATRLRLKEYMQKHDRFVMPGFYGALPDGTIKIMSRGGSDITGSILADILDADMYENWTDVSGILMADPRIVSKPKRIDTITYSELRELSYMGASVLHEEAIFPVKEKNIPINILNTNHPEEGGTIILEKDDKPSAQLITGIAGKKNFTVIAIYKNHMSDEIGIIRKALEVCESYRISIEHIPSGIDSFSIVVNYEDVKDVIYDMVGEMKKACHADDIKIIDNIALIATVGRQMMYKPGISGKLFAVLGQNNINIRMIAQGTDEMNIIVGVENEDYEKTVKTIYESFVI